MRCSFSSLNLNANQARALARVLRQETMHHITKEVNFPQALVECLENELIDACKVGNCESNRAPALTSAANNAAGAAKFSTEEAMNLALEIDIKMKVVEAKNSSITPHYSEDLSDLSGLRIWTTEDYNQYVMEEKAKEKAQKVHEVISDKEDLEIIVID